MFVLLDSNVWLAALTADGFCRRVVDFSTTHCIRVVTPFICDEIREKLVMKFRRTPEQADELVSRIVGKSLLRNDVAEIPSTLRDPDDNPILAAAVAYNCAFLVTGDKDLLVLEKFSGVEIVTVREFSARLNLR